jgi:hypothetical protein
MVFGDLSVLHGFLGHRGRWPDGDRTRKLGIVHGFTLEKVFKARALHRIAPEESTDEPLDVWGDDLGWVFPWARLM